MEILPVKLQTVFTQFKEMSIWSFCLAKRRVVVDHFNTTINSMTTTTTTTTTMMTSTTTTSPLL